MPAQTGFLAAFVAASLFSSGSAAAAGYPTRPITLVVPFLAGAAPDTVARNVGRELSKRLHQTVVVENKTGAGGGIAGEFVAKAAPDGYVLFAATDAPLVINPFVYPKLPYDTLKSFEPISILARSGFYMVVCPDLPVKNLQEFIALGKKKNLSYASSGFGSNHHLVGELLKQHGKFEMTHVPYQGAAAALVDVMNCSVDAGFVAVGTVLPQLKAGNKRLKPIAITTAAREPRTPDIPSIAESGFPAVDMEAYYTLLAPHGTPQNVIDLIAKESAEIMRDPEVRERFLELGLTPVGSTPAEFRARLEADLAKYGKVAKEIGLKAQ